MINTLESVPEPLASPVVTDTVYFIGTNDSVGAKVRQIAPSSASFANLKNG